MLNSIVYLFLNGFIFFGKFVDVPIEVTQLGLGVVEHVLDLTLEGNCAQLDRRFLRGYTGGINDGLVPLHLFNYAFK